jgi:hypothetical protein
MSGSALSQREIMPLMTTESSTSMTRSGSWWTGLAATGFVNAILILTELKSVAERNTMAVLKRTLSQYCRG